MGDPIKNKLKKKRIRPRNIPPNQNQTEQIFNIVPRNNDDNLIRRIHNVNTPSDNIGNPSLGVIDHYVKRINKNQKELEKIEKYKAKNKRIRLVQ